MRRLAVVTAAIGGDGSFTRSVTSSPRGRRGCRGPLAGHVEAGDGFEDAAYRELAEETGLRAAPGTLRLTDADIVLGEGRQIVFVDPRRLRELAMADSARYFVEAFVNSATYRELAADAGPDH